LSDIRSTTAPVCSRAHTRSSTSVSSHTFRSSFSSFLSKIHVSVAQHTGLLVQYVTLPSSIFFYSPADIERTYGKFTGDAEQSERDAVLYDSEYGFFQKKDDLIIFFN